MATWNICFTLACAGLGIIASSGCGSAPATTPSIPSVAGTWLGEQTVGSLTGGECLGPVLQDLVGLPSQFRGTLTQSGRTVTATLNIQHTGGVCTFTGSIDGNVLVLTATGCTESKVAGVSCPNGELRDVLPASETLQATISSNTISGSAVENLNVLVSGTSTSVGTLLGMSSFILTRSP
jgi:hypothetical protein